MNKKGNKKQDKEVSIDLGDIEELLGINDQEVLIDFQREDCGIIDPVPDFVIEEFSYDLKKGEEVELECPECGGTLKRKK